MIAGKEYTGLRGNFAQYSGPQIQDSSLSSTLEQ